jgi:hypothetical protein
VSTALAAALATLLHADLVPPDQAAAIGLDQKAAQAEVAKKYDNKKPSELSGAERAQMTRDLAAAEQRVLEKHGVDAKTWARQQMQRSPREAAAQGAREQALADQRKKDGEARAKAEASPQEVQIQRGFSDANPVTLEEKKTDGVVIEHGIPADAAADQAAASGQAAEEPAAPAPAAKGRGGAR